VAVGAGSLWVVSTADNSVYRVDPKTFDLVASISVGHGPSAIAVRSEAVWVSNGLDGTVMLIRPGSNSVASVTQVGRGPNGIAVGAGGVWVANEFAGTLTRLDSSGQVMRTIHVGNRPGDLAVAGRTVYLGVRAGAGEHRGGTIRYLLPPGPLTSDLRTFVDPSASNFFSGE